MLLIKAKDIYVEFMGRGVLDIEQLELYEFDRIGLVGANGAGKSTLLKALLGKLPTQHGKIAREGTFTYIPQLEEAVTQDVQDHAIAGKLGVSQIHVETMSGGEETRLKIVQALSGEVHGIFADEPTSHLDREGIDFLVNRFKHYSGALLIISHDRYFLDQVIDKLDQKAKGADRKNRTDSGGRLGHQKSQGSKQRKLHNAASNMERRSHTKRSIPAEQGVGIAQPISDCGKRNQ